MLPTGEVQPRLPGAEAVRDVEHQTPTLGGVDNPAQLAFVAEYLANGYNAAAAYRKAYPDCKSDGAVRACSSRLLASANVRRLIAGKVEALHLSADEALHLISQDATADIRLLFDAKGRLLPPHRWPDEIARSVKAIRPGVAGMAVILNDTLKARELLAIAGGKLRQHVDHTHTFDHAAYLAGTDTPPDPESQ